MYLGQEGSYHYILLGWFPTLVAHLYNPLEPPTFFDSIYHFPSKNATLDFIGLFWDPGLLAPIGTILG